MALTRFVLSSFRSSLFKKTPKPDATGPGMPFFILDIFLLHRLRAISGTPSIPYERLYRLGKQLQSTVVLQAFYRLVFWLPDHPSCCAFPFPWSQWPVQRSFPVTAAGRRRIHTVFPGSLVLNQLLYYDILFDGATVNKILINA